MSIQSISLSHHIRRPDVHSSSPPPLLLVLHGFGKNEEELIDLASQIDERYFVVSARGPITLKSDAYAWFPMNFTPTGAVFDIPDVENCRLLLLRFIDELIEAYGLERRQVYVMGFSQGAIMSSILALTEPDKLAGIITICGRIPTEILPQIKDFTKLAALPMFIGHGTADTVIPIAQGRACRDFFENLSVKLTYREYFMGHQVSSESIADISKWLADQLELSSAYSYTKA